MKMLKIILLAALLGAALSARTPAEGNRSAFRDLELTAGQTKLLEAHRKENNRRFQAEKRELQKAHRALLDELDKDNPNTAVLAKRKRTLLDLESARIDALVRSTKDLKQMLTKEQFVKLRKRQEKQFQKDFGRPPHPSGERPPEKK
ncbi:MAG: hypothetical protein LBD99_00630 [Candidatus Margulisbacteria bacterium]|jgi:hypothetical protein|nr:hypothetical protein [Candidatus Margulisiibacteriota bacterium]